MRGKVHIVVVLNIFYQCALREKLAVKFHKSRKENAVEIFLFSLSFDLKEHEWIAILIEINRPI